MAQDRKNQAGDGEREAERVQEDPGTLHQLWEEPETRKDKLGDASVPFRATRRGERRRARGFQDLLSDPAPPMQLVCGEE